MLKHDDKTEILDAIQTVAESVQSLATHMDRRFEAVDQRFEVIDRRFEAIDRRFEAIDQRFNGLEGDMRSFKSEIISHIDWFAAQHNRYDMELLALRQTSLRHEERIEALEAR